MNHMTVKKRFLITIVNILMLLTTPIWVLPVFCWVLVTDRPTLLRFTRHGLWEGL